MRSRSIERVFAGPIVGSTANAGLRLERCHSDSGKSRSGSQYVGRTFQSDPSENVGKFPFDANSRAKVNHEAEGSVKLLAEAKTDRILSVHMIGRPWAFLLPRPGTGGAISGSLGGLGSHAGPMVAADPVGILQRDLARASPG